MDEAWKRWDATDSSRWRAKLGKTIVGVRVEWEEEAIDQKGRESPQTLELAFEDGSAIWLSALEIREKSIYGQQDHITIFFEAEVMARYNPGYRS